jgi:hypothetical protein
VSTKFLISVVAMFVLSMVLDYVIHGMLLYPDYSALPSLFRAQQDAANHFAYMLLGHVFISIGFVWIYLKGREAKPFMSQGVRYGLAISVLATIPMYLIYFAVQPLPGDMVVKQILFEVIRNVGMGVVVAWMNR